ncbi:uncharacterized protein NPIL_198791 [Nephila pilipes]|uniref:Uncharacterized protein n=1 Tax=Nephila pilipes TaxID=299642 RepID=A0A8X6UUF6_NEPPI|nr:uncharacterized protein NPIL_198791 [Nephila pilipes]
MKQKRSKKITSIFLTVGSQKKVKKSLEKFQLHSIQSQAEKKNAIQVWIQGDGVNPLSGLPVQCTCYPKLASSGLPIRRTGIDIFSFPFLRELFFEIFVLQYAVLVNLMEIMDGIDDENTFLLDDELHSDTDTDISSNYLDYSSDD